MPTTPLLPLPEGLEITSISEMSEELLVRVTSHRETSCCPLCKVPSSAIHSYYRRKPRDLPCAGRPIRLLLTAKKFFCREPECSRKIFVERLPDLIEVSSRLTMRLRIAVQEIGFATCGKGGERLSCRLGIPISDATLLWSLYLAPLPQGDQIEVVGIDDWSYRRGKRYGSIIVDLRTHKIIDLLPERTVESVIAWLEAHQDVRIVSRDRGSVYADGVTQGAPLAIQVCDRWHLLKNLGEAVEAFLVRAQVRLPETPTPSSTREHPETARVAPTLECPLTTYSATPAQQGRTQARLLRKWKLSQRVQELHAGGMSLSKIGKELDLARGTVRKYVRQQPDSPLPTPRSLRVSKLDPYEDYILTRLSQGGLDGLFWRRETGKSASNRRASCQKTRKSSRRNSNWKPRSSSRRAENPRPKLHETSGLPIVP